MSQPGVQSIRRIRHQNYFATIIIQRYWRGYHCRKHLWAYGGHWYVYYVLKVQCAWRIFHAKLQIRQKFQQKVIQSVHSLHSLFYYWRSRKLRHMIHATFIKKCVVKLQSAYRRKIAKRLYYIVKIIHRNKMAIRVQNGIRRFIGLRRSYRRLRLQRLLLESFKQYDENDAILQFTSQSITQILTKSIYLIHQTLINAEFIKAYHNVQQSISKQMLLVHQQPGGSVAMAATNLPPRMSMLKSNKSLSLLQHSFQDMMNTINCPEHLKSFLIEFLLYLTLATNWSKYGRTRQLHVTLLERNFGLLSQQFLRALPSTLIPDIFVNKDKRLKALLAEENDPNALWMPEKPKTEDVIDNGQKMIYTSTRTTSSRQLSRSSSRLSKGTPSTGTSRDNSRPTTANASAKPALTRSSVSADNHIVKYEAFNNRKQRPSVGNINSSFSELVSKDLVLKKQLEEQNQSNEVSQGGNPRGSIAGVIPRNLRASMSSASANTEANEAPKKAKEEELRIFSDISIRWNDYFIDEIVDVYFQITSLSHCSFVKLFDALIAKVDILLFLSMVQLRKIAHQSNQPPVDPVDPFTAARMAASMLSASKGNTAIATGSDKQAMHYNYFLPFFYGYEENNDVLRTVITRAFRLLDRAKSLVVPGSLDEFEVHYRVDYFHALSARPILLYETSREFSVKLIASNEPYDVEAERIKKEEEKKAKNSNKKEDKGGVKTTSTDSITVKLHQQVILAGNLIFLAGFVTQVEDIQPPPPHQQTEICKRLMEFFIHGPGHVEEESSGAAGQGSPSPSKKASRQVSFKLNPNKANSTANVQESLSNGSKSLFPLSIRSMILFPAELNQLVSLFRSNFVDEEEEEEQQKQQAAAAAASVSADVLALLGGGAAAAANPATPAAAATKKTKKKKTKVQTSNFYLLQQKYPSLGEKTEEFVNFLAHTELKLSLSYNLHYPEFNNGMGNAGSNGNSALNTARSGTSAESGSNPANPASSGGNLKQLKNNIIANTLEPLFYFHIPVLDHKRSQLLANNDIRYATIVLQRVFRGFMGRKRFQFVLMKKKEIIRRRWLAWKVLDKLKIMRAFHEYKATVIQALAKGWLWRKHLRILNKQALRVQCKFRIFRAKCRVIAERKRRFGGPQVIDMYPPGRVVVIQQRKIHVKIFRCGQNYKIRGTELQRGEIFYGILYIQQAKDVLEEYNQRVINKYIARNELPTSVACKNEQIFPWQYEKIANFIFTHLDFVRTIIPVTNQMFAIPGEEQDQHNRNNDVILLVCLDPDTTTHMKVQEGQNLTKSIYDHPFLPHLQQEIKDSTKHVRLGNRKRKNLIKDFNANNKKGGNNNKKNVTMLSSSGSLPALTSNTTGGGSERKSALQLAGEMSLQGASQGLGGIR